MHFSVLGPLEITEGRKIVEVGGLRQQHILATLLLNANRTVTVSRLAEATWDTAPPATAKEQVQNCVSMLRRTLIAAGAPLEVIATRASGYLLDIPEDDLDLNRFNAQVAQARQDAARGHTEQAGQGLRAALAMWHGSAFDDLSSRVVRSGGDRLNEQRLVVMEECISLEMSLGRHRELVGELSALTAEYPLREELRAQLMLALYRSGRQAEALEVYRHTRKTMIDELGLEPGAYLQQVEQSILAADPELDLTAPVRSTNAAETNGRPVPHELPPPAANLIGLMEHEEAIGEVLARRDDNLPDGPAVCVVVGEGGVGKTALIVQAAHRLKDRYPDGQLFADLRGSGPEPADINDVITHFLRALGVAMSEKSEDRLADYRSAVAERRLLIVLDDVPDEETLTMLLPATPSCALLATSRTPLVGRGIGRLIHLEPFTREAAVELLAAMVGDGRVERETSSALRVVDLCGRLPLAVRGAGLRLAAKPHWSVRRLADLLGPESRRFNELERGGCHARSLYELPYRRLRPQARKVFRSMGLLSTTQVTARQCALVAQMSVDEVEEALEEVMDLGLIDVEQTGNGQVVYHLPELSRVFSWEQAAAEGMARAPLSWPQEAVSDGTACR